MPLSLLVKAILLRAKLLDSVPPEVKTISLGWAPMLWAITFRELSMASEAEFPNWWGEAELPYWSSIKGIIAFKTKGSILLVAALSK